MLGRQYFFISSAVCIAKIRFKTPNLENLQKNLLLLSKNIKKAVPFIVSGKVLDLIFDNLRKKKNEFENAPERM